MVSHLASSSVSPVSGCTKPSVSSDSTDCVTERLPELASVSTRSPGSSNTCSLRNEAMLSMPALVRVSEIITRPPRTHNPTQYVIDSPSVDAGFYSGTASNCHPGQAKRDPGSKGQLQASGEAVWVPGHAAVAVARDSRLGWLLNSATASAPG